MAARSDHDEVCPGRGLKKCIDRVKRVDDAVRDRQVRVAVRPAGHGLGDEPVRLGLLVLENVRRVDERLDVVYVRDAPPVHSLDRSVPIDRLVDRRRQGLAVTRPSRPDPRRCAPATVDECGRALSVSRTTMTGVCACAAIWAATEPARWPMMPAVDCVPVTTRLAVADASMMAPAGLPDMTFASISSSGYAEATSLRPSAEDLVGSSPAPSCNRPESAWPAPTWAWADGRRSSSAQRRAGWPPGLRTPRPRGPLCCRRTPRSLVRTVAGS